ncbi:S41 family peptidase [Pricia sp.]|uniref:S41 family peptidase n=1 Tax=Pricia sp. TaxID=2268138 RepID=UPI0035945DBD
MNLSLPSETIFHVIESTIKEYRKFAQKNISEKIPNMTVDQGLVLLFLNEHPDLNQKEIAELVFKDNASMTRMINTMVQKKYLQRSMNPEDRRRYKLEITEKGKKVLKILPPIIHHNRNSSLKGITKNELNQLEIILNKIRTNCAKKHSVMKNIRKSTLVTVLFLIPFISQLNAQQNIELLTAKEQQTVVDSIGSKLNANYVFPEIAEKMVSNIESKLGNGNYTSILDPQEFAAKLTDDIQSISNDKHLRVTFAPDQIAEQQQTVNAEDSIAYLNRYVNNMKRNNFGFKEVKIMAGNIGYLDLRSFSSVEYAGETAVSAMNFLSNADAIIIDLRNNGGGSPAMIQLITSYLFGNEPIHLNNFFWRPSNQNSQTWTLPYVSGTRSPDTPVYVLTSSGTFSAAEEFSYNLKHLERATLVGETTGGGAHPGGPVMATDRFMVWVPTGRAINPITNTNWESTGVSPHIETPASDALDVAYMEALALLTKNNKDEGLQAFYEWPLAELKLKTNPVNLDVKTLKSFIGIYGPRKITFENGQLFYQRGGGTKYELLPYSNNEFLLKGFDSFRILFLAEGNRVTALQGLYDNGSTDKNAKE